MPISGGNDARNELFPKFETAKTVSYFMKKLLLPLLICCVGCTAAVTDDYGYKITDGAIVYNTPARPSDQQSMLGFAAEPIDTVRIGFVGLGMRGSGAVARYTFIDGVKIVALCDLRPEMVEKAQQTLSKAGLPCAAEYSGEEGYKALCERDDLDLVYLAVPWQLHTSIAVYAMEHGKHVAVEVPAATSIEECWKLVNTSERTRRHCMMLENCCYDFFELTCLNMAQQGLFGEIYHGEGSYQHCLEPYWDAYQGDWRMKFNRDHSGDAYPTHGLGPVAQALNIHRGDKMERLVSVQTDAFAGQEICDRRYGEGAYKYANGDNTSTLIRTHNGKSILIEHGVASPRPYSRMYSLTGTKGFAEKYPVENIALGASKELSSYDDLDAEVFLSSEERERLMAEYQHPITRENSLVEKAKQVGGHGGMDFIMDYRLIYCLHRGLPLDQDVYDAAEWSSLVELSEVSIENGSMPVVMPDFTRGEWDKLRGLQLAL